MTSVITLTDKERNDLLYYYRSPFHDSSLRLRCHIILLLADGHTWAVIVAVLYCSTRTIARWKQRFCEGGVEALMGLGRGRDPQFSPRWADRVVRWVREKSPQDFGVLRSRWCCSLIVWLLCRDYGLCVSRETVRRWLHQNHLVRRRPRPVVGRTDPNRETILEELRQLLRDLPEDETVVFQDEVDLNLNPEIGFCWMRRGQQATIVTPGDNQKCYLAASLHWRTGALIGGCIGDKRNGVLVAEHLEERSRRLRRYKKIHVIWDNASFHTRGAAQRTLEKYPDRLVAHLLPTYAPDCNPIERVWWHLREEITRNHQCQSLQQLVDLVFDWLEGRKQFWVEDSIYTEEPSEDQNSNAA